jgi:hypothetical protein
MSWRERATAIRAVAEKRKSGEAAAAARAREAESALLPQTAFARRIIDEVLIPVLKDFGRIVTGAAGSPVFHEYHQRAFGLTYELDSLRFSVGVFLLPEPRVRLAVSLMPSSTEGWHRDFPLNARNGEIEEWFGTSLSRLYEVA